jgi:hypothetical protein
MGTVANSSLAMIEKLIQEPQRVNVMADNAGAITAISKISYRMGIISSKVHFAANVYRSSINLVE